MGLELCRLLFDTVTLAIELREPIRKHRGLYLLFFSRCSFVCVWVWVGGLCLVEYHVGQDTVSIKGKVVEG
jgi:hypothetical protein